MSERFFISVPPAAGRGVLEGDEARHLARVLRAKVGDTVTLFDGRGREWPARVAVIGRDRVELDADEPHTDAPPRGARLTLAVALPKGERQKWMVEKLTELGVRRLVPLETTRGVAEATASAQARLERGVIEACKQCGRNTLMEIAAGRTLASLLAERLDGFCVVIAQPGGRPLADAVPAAATDILALVGPEGGFTDDELAAAEQAGAIRVSLGPHILRVETAAIALAARFAG
ncbi:MAG: RsmE family RNA methyltransferase [Planctomycetia bacterium]